MGMGRNSSRIASKRIANSGKGESDVDDYDNDSDWNYSSDRKSSKKKRDKNSPRRSKSKGKNGDSLSGSGASSDGSSVFANYETMSIEERKALLMQMCGVISEHTKKMCTRSHRCPQHTDEQRRTVRHFLLGRQGSSLLDTSDEVQVDVDTLEEGDSQMLRLWESGNSANASPADSTSTNNGASSSKKEKKKLHPNRPSHSCNSKKSRVRPSQGSVGSNSSQGSTGQSSFEII
ncbi:ataxin-7-like protein 3 [Centruroides vittatus]|uniref:ataxin-7-like protein 3 n=1 Tax=Centruroides vittatus TaxID=120091 RepID=UPI00350F8494